MQSMIFAAGLGTRLKPLTDRMPKALVRVGGKPLLEHTIERLRMAGCKNIVVNVHHFANQIIDFLNANDFGIDIRISDETEQLLDTGGGIKKAAPLFDSESPILIHNVDILSNVDLHAFYDRVALAERQSQVDALLLVSGRKTKRYLIFDETMRLVGWTNVETGEVKSPFASVKALAFVQPYGNKVNNVQNGYRLFAFSGIHVVNFSMFKTMEGWPDKFPIMDFYLQNAHKLHFYGYVKDDLQLMDVGKLDTLHEAEEFVSSGKTRF